MGGRIRVVVVFLVVLLAGAFLGSAYSQRWATAPAPAPPRRVLPPGERVRVEVLNAGGVQGRAREATERLRDAGFDVVFFGNAETFDVAASVVLDRVERLASARAVADELGIRNVRSEPDSNLYLDVSVLLGRDWSAPPPAHDAGESAPERKWWDPRGWLGR